MRAASLGPIPGRYRFARKARHDRVEAKARQEIETWTAAFLAVQTMHLEKNQAPLRAPDSSRPPSRTAAADVMMVSMVRQMETGESDLNVR